jgi:hypothetical protein
MPDITLNQEFIDEFLNSVLKEIQEYLNPGLYSKRYRIKLYWTDEEKKRISDLAYKCFFRQDKMPDDCLEWFSLAYMTGLVYNCRNVNGKVLLRTFGGYEDYETLSKKYPTELLNTKLSSRKAQYEELIAKEPSLATLLLERPIVENLPLQQKSTPEQARELTVKEDIRKYLCPALKSVSDDAFEIAKVITPILLSLSLAGTIVLPLAPMLFANLAVVISKMGVAALCVGYIDDRSKDKG